MQQNQLKAINPQILVAVIGSQVALGDKYCNGFCVRDMIGSMKDR